MKTCPKCGAQMEDNALFCASCGANFNNPYAAAPVIPEWDHTAEFDAQDVAENKLYAMVCYLFGAMGMIVALLANKNSSYVVFHVKQELKIMILQILVLMAAGILVWTFIVPAAGAICLGILIVVRIICFVSVCKGEAKEPAIVRSFSFLK